MFIHEARVRGTLAPTLPTRPLVLRTLVLPSVLRRDGELRLPMLRSPLPDLVEGVLGLRGLAESSWISVRRFSTSLSSMPHFVVVVVVVVQLTARRLPLRLTGDCDAFRDEVKARSACSSSLSLSPRLVRCMLTISVSGLISKGSFSVLVTLRPVT